MFYRGDLEPFDRVWRVLLPGSVFGSGRAEARNAVERRRMPPKRIVIVCAPSEVSGDLEWHFDDVEFEGIYVFGGDDRVSGT